MSVDFKKNGDLFLEDYFFRADEGSFNKDKLSIKATTTEGLGFVGRQEGVAAHCITLIKKI